MRVCILLSQNVIVERLDKTVEKCAHVKTVVHVIQWMGSVHVQWNIRGKTVKNVSYFACYHHSTQWLSSCINMYRHTYALRLQITEYFSHNSSKAVHVAAG